jgi:hypothetical protein
MGSIARSLKRARRNNRHLRKCGECSLCCYVFLIEELGKDPYVSCNHCKHEGGCTIYSERPPVCKSYRCAWLAGEIPLRWKPSKIGALINAIDSPWVRVFEQRKGVVWNSKELRRFLATLISQGTICSVHNGESWFAFWPDGFWCEVTIDGEIIRCDPGKKSEARCRVQELVNLA